MKINRTGIYFFRDVFTAVAVLGSKRPYLLQFHPTLEHGTVVAVIQLIGRLCVMVSLSSLSLYSIELFPTVVR